MASGSLSSDSSLMLCVLFRLWMRNTLSSLLPREAVPISESLARQFIEYRSEQDEEYRWEDEE